MERRSFISSVWSRYSKKLCARIENPKSAGFFTPEDALNSNMRLVIGNEKQLDSGEEVSLYLLIDESDGVIADAKFQVFGSSALIGAADVACELLLRKNYDQARRFSADLLDKHLQDKNELPAFPKEAAPQLNLVLSAIGDVADQCMDIPFVETYVSSPISSDGNILQEGEVYPNWLALSTEQKISVIVEVIERDIRPYIELDAGGVKVLNLLNDKEVIIAYEGSCTTCYSATGATLNAIQQILRGKVHPGLIVIPDLSFLSVT